jgi:hypothetical protein
MYSGEYDACDVTLSVYPHWAILKIYLTTVVFHGIPKVVGSIPTVVRHIFPVWIYTQSNITSIIVYVFVYFTNTMDHLHYRLNFDLDKNFITAGKSITKSVIFQSFVAKCCKMWII